MKNRYQRLSKEEKKEAKKRYIAFSERNKNYMSLLNRMLILGIIGLVYGLISSFFDAFILSVPVWSYIIDGVIVIFSVFLIVQKARIQSSTINKFLIDENNAGKVKEEPKKVEVKEEKKEEVKVEVKAEPEKVEVKEAPKKTTPKKTTTTKKAEKTEETIEMPITKKAKKRKHVSKNSKAKKAAKKKSKK